MAAYLIVDVDDLLSHFRRRNISVDLQELAVGLRGGAALASGLASADKLKAVAAANWSAHPSAAGARQAVGPRYVFKAAGYDVFDIPDRQHLADALMMHYFSFDPDPVDELILATTNADLLPLVRRVRRTRSARVRIWGSEDVVRDSDLAEEIIFQPLETLPGIQQSKNVAVYIDFENIAISLNEQGYTVNLDHLIEAFLRQAKAHGQVVSVSAYAPWGQRGSLPPMVDDNGREITDEAQNRLARANIDPVYNLPGKNSADMRIARDVIADSSYADAADIFIVASGDRDFNEVINSLRTRNKTVIVWAVRGAVSRVIENHPGIQIEYVEDFTDLQTHQSLSTATHLPDSGTDIVGFTPSQWSSVIIQFDQMTQNSAASVTRARFIDQLVSVGAVVNKARGEDLVAQALAAGILRTVGTNSRLTLDPAHPIVEKTRLIRDRIVLRVMNTLSVRDWEYVNYGFLLKGLAMDRELDRPGMNYSDQWRSDWIDCLVREHVLVRELVPHRHNPDDLVPVIKVRPDYPPPVRTEQPVSHDDPPPEQWEGISLTELERMEVETAEMVRRVVVSVEQFTSFRGFTWCPLGSLHKRLKNFDRGMTFQRAVEYLVENEAADVNEYANPQSEFLTKGISLRTGSPIVSLILSERDQFIRLLLTLYERSMVISENGIRTLEPNTRWNFPLWFSIMQTENVLNEVPGRTGQYNLFRTHHTVQLVADSTRDPALRSRASTADED
jgi:uncharacterized LabA/DUF88 family protein